MSHVVLMNMGFTGFLRSTLHVARRLEDAGHRVSIVSRRIRQDMVTDAGFEFRRFGVPEFRGGRPPSGSDIAALGARARYRLGRSKHVRDAADRFIEDRVAMLTEPRPDLVIIDVEMEASAVVASTLGIPLALYMPWFDLEKRRGLPPPFTHLQPPTGPRSWFASELAWNRYFLQRSARQARMRVLSNRNSTPARIRTLQEVAGSSLHWSTRRHRSWNTPLVFPELPLLSMTAAELDFPHETRRGLHHVGPMIHRGSDEADPDPRLDMFLDHNRDAGGRRPLVYCGFTTMKGTDESFFERIVQVAHRRSDWRFVLGLGGQGDRVDLDTLPANVCALDWAPQRTVLQHADCFVGHGGIGGINESVELGVPMVLYSGHFMEQDGVCARMQYHGVASVGDREHESSREIEARIERVLDDRAMQDRLGRFAEIVRSYESDQVLEQVVERLVDDC